MTRLDELEALLETDREEAALRLLALAPKLIAVARAAQEAVEFPHLIIDQSGDLVKALAALEEP